MSLFLEICNRCLHLTVSLSPPPPPVTPTPSKKVTEKKETEKKKKKKKIKAEISGGKKEILKEGNERQKK